jgi:hypothetical protein
LAEFERKVDSEHEDIDAVLNMAPTDHATKVVPPAEEPEEMPCLRSESHSPREDQRADLLVTGAYGHSRHLLRELIDDAAGVIDFR